jgi:D-sedoheptulose 7-phosphate isomerase
LIVSDPHIDKALADHQAVIAGLAGMAPQIEALATRMRVSLDQGGKIIWAGNGGSAADSQHLAAELVGRFRRHRKGLASIALTTDSSILTSVGNDFGFETIFARQIEALCRTGDVFVAISTSGNSANLVTAIETARGMGIHTVGFLGGSGGKMLERCDTALVVPSSDTPRVQEAHILIGHILCELLDAAYAHA